MLFSSNHTTHYLLSCWRPSHEKKTRSNSVCSKFWNIQLFARERNWFYIGLFGINNKKKYWITRNYFSKGLFSLESFPVWDIVPNFTWKKSCYDAGSSPVWCLWVSFNSHDEQFPSRMKFCFDKIAVLVLIVMVCCYFAGKSPLSQRLNSSTFTCEQKPKESLPEQIR